MLTEYALIDGTIMKYLDTWTPAEVAASDAANTALQLEDAVERALMGSIDDEAAMTGTLLDLAATYGLETLGAQLEAVLNEEPTTMTVPASALEVRELLDTLEQLN